MNLFKRGALVAGLLTVAGVAQAQVSSTITLTSDYDFRGFSQSAKDPAIQASLDYAFSNGFAIGAWASNVDFGDDPDVDEPDFELDIYGSYTASINDDTSWTVGFVYYTYPSSDSDESPEFYAGLNYKALSLKQWFSHDQFATDETGFYTEANYTVELPQNFSLLLHGGYTWGDFTDEEIFDYAVGFGYSVGNFSLSLKLHGTDASGDAKIRDDVFNNEARAIFAIATTLPWGE